MSINFGWISSPFCVIAVDDEEIPFIFTERLIRFEYDEDDEKADMVTLTFSNFDYVVSDSDFFTRNSVITIQWGYLDAEVTEPISLVIKDIEGLEEFKITAYEDGIVRKRSQKKIGRPAGSLSKKGTKTTKFELYDPLSGTLKEKEIYWKSNRTSILPSSSKANNNKNYISPEKWSQDPYFYFTYSVGSEGWLKSFNPSIKTQNTPDSGSTAIEGLDLDQKSFYSDVAKDVVKDIFGSKYGDMIIDKTAYVIDLVDGTIKKAENEASEIFQKILGKVSPTAKNRLDSLTDTIENTGTIGGIEITTEAELTMYGSVHVHCGIVIHVSGVGNLFSGKWYVKSARHTIDNNGYEISLTLLRPTNTLGSYSKTVLNAEGNSTSLSELSNAVQSQVVTPKYQVDLETGEVEVNN